MTIQDIKRKNELFQDRALGLAELIPRSDMMEFATLLKRKSLKIHVLFGDLLEAPNMSAFWGVLESMEEVMDDLVYELDRLHDLNNLMKIKAIDEFIKSGYDLLSVYSISSDQVVKQRNEIKRKV